MTFKIKEFLAEPFEPRIEEVAVPALKKWFEGKSKPVWKVRGLDGKELAKVHMAVDRSKKLATIAEKVFGGSTSDQADALKEIADPSTPEDSARRITMLVLGSVEPACDETLALKFCKAFPIEFWSVTQKISELTGLGQLPGKSKPSGETKK